MIDDPRHRHRQRTAARRLKHLQVVTEIKLQRGCLDCGYNGNPAALHFDHRDPGEKLFEVSRSLSLSLRRILAEIDKCDVRCANCHAARSQREGHSKRHTK